MVTTIYGRNGELGREIGCLVAVLIRFITSLQSLTCRLIVCLPVDHVEVIKLLDLYLRGWEITCVVLNVRCVYTKGTVDEAYDVIWPCQDYINSCHELGIL